MKTAHSSWASCITGDKSAFWHAARSRSKLRISHYREPHIFAEILQKAELVPGKRVLCIGSGTGYLCALAAELVRAFASAFTLTPDQIMHQTCSVFQEY